MAEDNTKKIRDLNDFTTQYPMTTGDHLVVSSSEGPPATNKATIKDVVGLYLESSPGEGKWNDGTTAGDIYYNAGNVGIGTTDPDFLLDLDQADGGVQLKMGRSNTDPGTAWMGADTNGFHLGVGEYAAEGGDVGDPNGFTVNTAGNVGIGTANPLAIGYDPSLWPPMGSSSSVGYNSTTLHIDSSNNAASIRLGGNNNPNGSAYLSHFAGYGTRLVVNHSLTPLILGTNSTTRLLITPAGNVGIGTTTPDHKLHVDGDVGINNQDKLYIGNEFNYLTSSAANDLNISTNRNLTFSSWIAGAVQTNVTIVEGGNVGIGTETPSAPLEVSSTTGGLIVPRMTMTEINNISNPTAGEIAYDTVGNDFYGYDGTSWRMISFQP